MYSGVATEDTGKSIRRDLLSPFCRSREAERKKEKKEKKRKKKEGKKSRAVTHYPRDSVPYPCGGQREREREREREKNADDEKRRRGGKGSRRLTSQPHERERGIK